MKSRFPAIILLIALPVLAFCALGAYFLVDKAPKLINAEKSEITKQYREIAESMITNGVPDVTAVQREKGWRQVSKIDKKFPWGVVEREGGRVLIWIEREDKSLTGVEREAIVDRTALWIYGGFGFAMLFVTAVAIVGIVLLIRYDRERESFLAGMVHDLKSPLIAIRGLAGRDPESVGAIADSMLAMVRNAQDFLGLGGRRSFDVVDFDIVPEIREAYSLFVDGFEEEESGPVAFDLPERLPVSADRMAVRQILWNLFSNAEKYAAPYGPVTVSARAKDGTAEIDFSDRGPGMTARQMRRAFDRFYRASGLHESGKGGFGIGLYTSRAAARRMGGELTVRANEPKGCVFTLVLKKLEVRE